ncbi:MarR family winged helix-turn-helix transcriptional regulator [Nocardioides sp. CFH 31398]|uniref:MarR family winged helix-turn-helix transcriptional regulator n=1 Tax=Nocardioides sp. CFH 31398 TaxID=2919579 RepID=UPI001F05E145|nr:MarR family transcriptional regulator [Nocardioides sp. CFH 31398]MCH1866581.1 MarR family transcriptional regulator [Nocardioides sp. CFH 31398]
MTDGPWLDERQQQVWRRWLAVETLLPAALHRELQADAGLSLQDFAVLVQLTEHTDGRLRVTDLARLLTWEKSRASHHLTRMEARGLVERRACPEDGRGSFVGVTEAGRRAIVAAAPGHVREVRALVFDGLSDTELEVLDTVLTRVVSRLEA